MPRILVVDDEKDILQVVEFNLRQAGFEVLTAQTAEDGLSRARAGKPDLIVLDLMLPDLPGTEVCRQIKQAPALRHVPIVMLTARTAEIDRVVGFELGADDYVMKPFSVRELVLRVQAILRRASTPAPSPERLKVGQLELDPQRHRCLADGKPISLTALEFKLLSTFLERADRVQSREQLLADVWGITADIETRTVDTHVQRLREKLGDLADYVETVRGVGYRLRVPGSPP